MSVYRIFCLSLGSVLPLMLPFAKKENNVVTPTDASYSNGACRSREKSRHIKFDSIKEKPLYSLLLWWCCVLFLLAACNLCCEMLLRLDGIRNRVGRNALKCRLVWPRHNTTTLKCSHNESVEIKTKSNPFSIEAILFLLNTVLWIIKNTLITLKREIF